MKTLIVYDSVHGNTESIAKAIGEAIAGDVQVLRAAQASASELVALDLLVVGGPTYGGRPTEALQGFLGKIPASALEGVNVAAFDTRLTAKWVRIFSFAAPKIARKLRDAGGSPVAEPEGFFVTGGKGPLKDGELERAAEWAKEIVKNRE